LGSVTFRHNFQIAMGDRTLWNEEFCRFVVGVVDFDVFFAEPLSGDLFADADASVFQRTEDGGGDVFVVHRDGAVAEQTSGQEAAGVDGHGGQFRFFLPRTKSMNKNK
jgi:hypothetical protein